MLERALQVGDLRVRRGSREVVRGVSFEAQHGALTAIVGPNGAGKSTVLKALMGFLPSEGAVLIAGRPAQTLKVGERAQTVSYVPQQSALTLPVSVYDLVAQGRYAHRHGFSRFMPRPEPQIEAALERTGLSAFRARSFPTLSGGEQRRVLLARALASEARILLLDEPTAGLDVAHVLNFFTLIRGLIDEGYCVLSVFHDLADVRRHAEHTLMLQEGKVAAWGPTADVVRADHVQRVYGVELREGASLGYGLPDVSP